MKLRVLKPVGAGMREWAEQHPLMKQLQEALNVAHPTGKPPTVSTIAELVLVALMNQHERHLQGTLGRLNTSLARLMDDLDDLRNGRQLTGAAAQLSAQDMKTVQKALDELKKFEDDVRFMLGDDGGRNFADNMALELESGLRGRGKGARGPRNKKPTPMVKPGVKPTLPWDSYLSDVVKELRRIAPSARGFYTSAGPSRALRRAARNLVAASGGKVRSAIQQLILRGGADVDELIIAVLWSCDRICPGTKMKAGSAADMHQMSITGLPYEWSGRAAAGENGGRVGLDGIKGGYVTDAKFSNKPAGQSPHLIGGAGYKPGPPPDTVLDADAELKNVIREADAAKALDQRADRMVEEQQYKMLDQMMRQLAFADENGLRGIKWVINDEELKAAIEALSAQLPGRYSHLEKVFVTGGAL